MLQSLLALSTNEIVVIVVAAVAVAALLTVGAILFARSGKSKHKAAAPKEETAAPEEETAAPEETAVTEETAAPEETAATAEPVSSAEPAAAEETAIGEEPAAAEEAPAPVREEPAPAAESAAAPAETAPAAAAEIPAAAPAKPRLVNAKYDKSFTARLIQSSDKTKGWYGELKNELLSYKKVRARMSWRYESYRLGRDLAARFAVRGRTLCLFLDLDPEEYIDYGAEDVADKASHSEVPCLLRVRSDRRCRYAKALIAALMEKKGAAAGDKPAVDYYLPYEDDEPLLERGLVKPVKQRAHAAPAPAEVPAPAEKAEHVTVSVKEAGEQMTDEEAKARVEWSDRVTDKSKSAVVNVDTLSEYFEDGEYVGIAEMVSRIPYLSSKTTYIKVLARGRINKSLTVEADDFSPDAVKMIVLAGGRVIHTRSLQ